MGQGDLQPNTSQTRRDQPARDLFNSPLETLNFPATEKDLKKKLSLRIKMLWAEIAKEHTESAVKKLGRIGDRFAAQIQAQSPSLSLEYYRKVESLLNAKIPKRTLVDYYNAPNSRDFTLQKREALLLEMEKIVPPPQPLTVKGAFKGGDKFSLRHFQYAELNFVVLNDRKNSINTAATLLTDVEKAILFVSKSFEELSGRSFRFQGPDKVVEVELKSVNRNFRNVKKWQFGPYLDSLKAASVELRTDNFNVILDPEYRTQFKVPAKSTDWGRYAGLGVVILDGKYFSESKNNNVELLTQAVTSKILNGLIGTAERHIDQSSIFSGVLTPGREISLHPSELHYLRWPKQ